MPAALLARAAHIDERELVDWGSVAEPLGEPVSLTRGLLLHRDDDGGNETGLWVCTPGCWRCAIERPELCHFLAGRAVYLSLHECDLCLKEAVRREGPPGLRPGSAASAPRRAAPGSWRCVTATPRWPKPSAEPAFQASTA